jgi:UDP-glucose 4,6-dehydratase
LRIDASASTPHARLPSAPLLQFTLLAARGAPLPIHGDGAATRSYLHVADVAAAFEVVLRKGVAGETYNIGSRRERTVIDVARDVVGAVAAAKATRGAGASGAPAKAANGTAAANGAATTNGADAGAVAAATSTLAHVRDRAFNDRRYFICDEKLSALGWKETVPWERGLAETVEWYLEHGTPEAGHWDAGAVEAALAPHPVFALGGGGGAPAGMSRANSGAPPPPDSPGLRPPA